MKAKIPLFALVTTATLVAPSFERASQASVQTVPKAHLPKSNLPKGHLPKAHLPNSNLKLGVVTLGTRASGIVAGYGSPTALVIAVGKTTITPSQMPPQAATLFASDQVPNWAQDTTPPLPGNSVMWLYKHDTHVMGVLVDALGFVDTVLVTGTKAVSTASAASPASTRLESTQGAIDLGDDPGKILLGFGDPDKVETYKKPDGQTGASVWHYYLKGTPSTNVVFTLSNNRVARIQITSAL